MKHSKSILIIHPFLCYPFESGGHQALFHGICALKTDFDITLVFKAIDDDKTRKNMRELESLIPGIVLKPLFIRHCEKPRYTYKETFYFKVREWFNKAKQYIKKGCGVNDNSIPDDIPATIKYWFSTITPNDKEWVNHIYEVSHAVHYDYIQIEMPWIISSILALPNDSRTIHVHHELGFVRREQEIAQMSPTPYNEVCRQFTDMNEISLLNKYDAIITLSSIDKEKLLNHGVNVPVFSSMAIVEGQNLEFDDNHLPNEAYRLTFVGPSSHTPNLIGINWFLKNCWKKLKATNPKYTLDIVSSWNQQLKNDITEKYADVNFLGYVEDLGEALRNSIMIVPITIGSGIRMKILEAANRGIPFVSTTVGAEGIPVTNGKECFITDDSNCFVEAIIKLQDKSIRLDFIKNAKKMIDKHYSLEALRQNRLEIYESIQ